jgi:Ni/Co efflux regulator RcnB
MKKILSISLVVLMMTATYCFAQTDSGMKDEQKGEMKQQGMKMDDEMMKQMMEKCKPMMKQMMDEKKDMMQMMMDMMTMQEKIIKGPKAAEKKQMMKDMEQMKEKMKMMMSMPMDMTCMDDPQSAEPSKTDPHKH